jgi:hypothetical protein
LCIISGLIGVLVRGVVLGLTLAVSFGLAFAMSLSGRNIINHYTLRYLLSQTRMLPYSLRDARVVGYLDAMKDRILMRRVGGGWIFVHRSLMEHFAGVQRDHE